MQRVSPNDGHYRQWTNSVTTWTTSIKLCVNQQIKHEQWNYMCIYQLLYMYMYTVYKCRWTAHYTHMYMCTCFCIFYTYMYVIIQVIQCRGICLMVLGCFVGLKCRNLCYIFLKYIIYDEMTTVLYVFILRIYYYTCMYM